MAEQEKRFTRREVLQILGATAGLTVAAGVGMRLGYDRARADLVAKMDIDPALEEKLRQNGFFIYRPQGETIASLRENGVNISRTPLGDNAQFERETSKYPWIAVNPEYFYQQRGQYDTLRVLRRTIREESAMLQQYLGEGVELIPGEAVDYVGLEHAFRTQTGKHLLRPGMIYTSTRAEGYVIGVGKFNREDEIDFDFALPDKDDPFREPSDFLPAGILVPKLPDAA